MYTLRDIHICDYGLDHDGLVINYQLEGDPREYYYAVPPEMVRDVYENIFLDEAKKISQYDALLIIEQHLSEKAEKKAVTGTPAVVIFDGSFFQPSLNIYRTY